MDYRTLEATVILSCLVVLITVSALPWKTVNSRQAKVEIKDAYFMGIHHARAICKADQSDAGLLFIKDANDVTDLLALLRNTSANVGDSPKRLYISRYRNSSHYYQATWLETDTDQYVIPDADIDQMCPEDYHNNNGDCQAAFNSTSRGYDDANTQCKMMSGGTLAAIKDMDQWDTMTGELHTDNEYWIGAKYGTSDWVWENGMDITETFPTANITNGSYTGNAGDCAFIRHNGTDWEVNGDSDCTTQRLYVCQAPMDAGKLCMVIESASGHWAALKSAGGDVVFKNEYCCVPEMMVDGVLCTDGVTSSRDAEQLLNETCEGGCGHGWFMENNKCYTAVEIDTSNPNVTGTYEAELTCYSISPASDLASSIDDMTTHKFLARMLNMKMTSDMSGTAVKMAYLGLNDIDSTIGYHDHNGNAMTAYLKGMWTGPDNQTVEVDRMHFTENCVVLNATGAEWTDVKQQTVGDVTCCKDLMITMAICERPMNESVVVADADSNVYAKECYEHVTGTYEAELTCYSISPASDLASSIDDMTTHKFLARMLNMKMTSDMSGTAVKMAYLGLNDIDSTIGYHDHNGNAMTAYLKGMWTGPDNQTVEVDGMNFTENCVVLNATGAEWTDVKQQTVGDVTCCKDLMITMAICERPMNESVVVADADSNVYAKECYEHVTGTYEAELTCYSISPTSDLASSIDDMTTHKFLARMLNMKMTSDMSGTAVKMAYLGLNDIDSTIGYHDHNGNAMTAYLKGMWTGPDNQTVEVDGMNFTENCVVLNATGAEWTDVKQQTVGDVTCCKDLMITMAICERPMNESVVVADADSNVYAKECYEHINDCKPGYCINGVCEDRILRPHCNCTLGYRGDRCEHDIDYCTEENTTVEMCDATQTKQDGCSEVINLAQGTVDLNCTCMHRGINGSRCENLFDPCGSDPCQWGGRCVKDSSNDYDCMCPAGTTGNNCQTNIDDCNPSGMNVTCLNGGNCTDHPTILQNATCACPRGFIGLYCETEISCQLNDLPNQRANWNRTWNANDMIGGSNGFGLHAMVNITCNEGFKFSDDGGTEKSVVCEQSGWVYPQGYTQNNFPACDAHCETLPVVENAEYENNSTKVGTIMTYTCLEGHRFPDNTSSWNTTCLAPSGDDKWGNWSSVNPPACEVMHCPELPNHPFQSLDTRNTSYNTTVTFWCDVGYELYDGTTARTLKCMIGGWAASLPPCDPVKCPEIDIDSMTAINRNTSERVYNTYVKYECDAGQRMVDGGTYRILKCDASKEWSDEVTSCGFDRCYPLPYVVNATADTNNATCDQGDITLNCDLGHRFFEQDRGNDIGVGSDSTTIKCDCDTSKNQWRPLTIKACKPVNCPVFNVTRNAYRSTDNTLYGTVLGILCDKGHYYDADTLHGALYTECDGEAKWNLTDAEVTDCWPIQCENPPTVKNGTRTFGNSTVLPAKFNYTWEIHYECDSGTKFIDGRTTRTIFCNDVGKFSDNDVSCIVERCEPIPERENVVPNTTDTAWYTTVSYKCAPGYEWASHPEDYVWTTSCEVSGSLSDWDQKNVPKCVAKKCPVVNPPEHSTSNVYQPVPFPTIKEITCDLGYTFKYYGKLKSMRQRCNENGEWEWIDDKLHPDYPVPTADRNNPHICVILECHEDPYAYLRHKKTPRIAYVPWFKTYPTSWGSVTNATISNDTYRYNEVANYTCFDGYQYKNKDILRSFRCTENETWEYIRPEPYINDDYKQLNTYECEVKFCPPVPDWSYNITLTNLSNSNEFESEILYSCKADQIFSDCAQTVQTETGDVAPCETIRKTKCHVSKQWQPPFDTCQAAESIGAELVGFRAEAPNSVAFGTFACSLLSIMLACIILLDLIKLYSDCKMMKSNISSMMNKSNKVSDSSAGLNESTA